MDTRAVFARGLAVALALAFVIPAPAAAQTLTFIEGDVRDSVTNALVADVCVTLGPPTVCTTATNAAGYYRIDGVPISDTTQWEVFFTKVGYQNHKGGPFRVRGPTRADVSITPGAGTCARPATPTRTIFMPNITKTLGGPSGFVTPFIIQNTNPGIITSLQIDFFRFSDGALLVRRELCVLRPGNSFALVPNFMTDLPEDTQFSVVARSFMTDAVAVVNEHQGAGARAEAASYVGVSSGATSVFLPNITRRFFGFVTPFIIQNLGTSTATATASFVSFDGSAPTVTTSRSIEAGRSKFVDPNSDDPALGAPGLVDGKQYAVTVTANQPVSVVVNTHNDAPTVAAPVFYSTNGLTTGAATLRGPYAVKNVPGVGAGVSTIVVQNMGTTPATPSLAFTPLGGGATVTIAGPSTAPGAAWAFDPRFVNGAAAQGLCGATASAGCVADGEYSFVASATGGSLAAVVNVIGAATAAGYSALPTVASRVFLPNVTRTLGGASGWSTPLLIQSATATTVTLSWFRFSDGTLVTKQTLTFTAGTAQRIDPRSVAGLTDDTQFSVVAEGASDGTLAAIVVELNFSGGDGAMVYEGFAR